MALTKPSLITPIAAFDATENYVFKFSVVGGSQVVGSRCIIKNNTTNVVVYDDTETSFRYEYNLPANSLTNGVNYNVEIRTIDSLGNESVPSTAVQFWCYRTPNIVFTNIPVSNVITNNSFSFEFSYSQNENEPLNTYTYNLYNSSGELLATSGEKYVNSSTVPFVGSYLFSGFEDNVSYSIEVIGYTVEQTLVRTVLTTFVVQYSQPDVFTLMRLENNCEGGYVLITSNLVSLTGQSNPYPPIYIDDKEVDLTNPSSWVKWSSGYSINNDMTARVWFRNPNNYSEIIQFSNLNGDIISIRFMLGYEDVESDNLSAYLWVEVTGLNGATYNIISNFVEPQAATDYYNAWLIKKDNLYEASLYVVE